MGCEGPRLAAAPARSTVTDTTGTPLTDRAVVCLDFRYSRGLGQFDTDGYMLS